MNKLDVAGTILTGGMIVKEDIIVGTGNKQFIFHTQTQYPNNPPLICIAPRIANTSTWDWSKQILIKDDGSLTVNSTIYAKEVKVCLNPGQGCDYVFANDYKLMNLNDLSSFVKTNKHLPDVAPAAVMEAEGINLSEMNTLLLRKIEELTLYVIDLKNEIDELKK